MSKILSLLRRKAPNRQPRMLLVEARECAIGLRRIMARQAAEWIAPGRVQRQRGEGQR